MGVKDYISIKAIEREDSVIKYVFLFYSFFHCSTIHEAQSIVVEVLVVLIFSSTKELLTFIIYMYN